MVMKAEEHKMKKERWDKDMALEQRRLQMEERRLQWEQEQKISDRLVFVHILASHEVAPPVVLLHRHRHRVCLHDSSAFV